MSKLVSMLGISDQIVVSSGNFLLAIILSKILTPNDFGSYALIWLVIISLGAFVNAWFSSPMLTIAHSLGAVECDEFIAILIKQMLILVLVLIFGITFIFYVSTKIISPGMFVLVLAGLLFFIFDFLRKVAIVKEKLEILLATDISTYVLMALGCIYASEGGLSQVSKIIFFAYLFGSLIFSAFLMPSWIILIKIKQKKIDLDRVWIRRVGFAKWTSYSSILQFLSSNAITIFAATVLSLADVGLLRLSQTFVSIFNPVFAGLDNYGRVFYSRILSKSGRLAMNLSFRTFAIKFLLVNLVFCIFFWFLGEALIRQFYPEHIDSHLLIYFSLYLVVTFLIGCSFILRMRLLVLEETKFIFKCYAISACISILLFYPLVAEFGGAGVIILMIIVQSVMSFSMLAPMILNKLKALLVFRNDK